MNEIKEIKLTAAQPGDLDEICALCSDVAARTPNCGWSAEYPNRDILTSDIASGSLYQLRHAGRVVSIMQIRPWADLMAGEEADDIDTWAEGIHNPCALGRFCVSPDFQGQGLGRRVMTESLATARRMGYDGARFHTLSCYGTATHLYDAMGFHRAGMVREYGKEFVCYEMKL